MPKSSKMAKSAAGTRVEAKVPVSERRSAVLRSTDRVKTKSAVPVSKVRRD